MEEEMSPACTNHENVSAWRLCSLDGGLPVKVLSSHFRDAEDLQHSSVSKQWEHCCLSSVPRREGKAPTEPGRLPQHFCS